jgi:hypothetical protein
MKLRASFFLFGVLLGGALQPHSHAQTAEWIWHANAGQAITNGEVRYFQKSFVVADQPSKAVLSVAADNRALVTINESPVFEVNGYQRATRAEVTAHLRAGTNVIALQAHNEAGVAGLLGRVEILLPKRKRQTLVTDASWLSAVAESSDWRKTDMSAAAGWGKVVSLGKVGMEPWAIR